MFRDRSDLLVYGLGAIGVVLLASVLAFGQSPQGGNGSPPNGNGQHGGQWSGYQRQGGDWKRRDHDRRHDKFDRRAAPQVSSAWFQRPYPYHLDYYKMRWGGSYAPYFGNLYGTPFGTPQVVGNGNWGAGGLGVDGYGFGNGYGPGVHGGQPNGFPGVPYSYSMMPEFPAEKAAPANGQTTPANGENLPAPKQ